MLRVPNVATPLIAATVVVPERTPAPGFASIARVTLPAKPVRVLPAASRAATRIAGAMVTPAAAVEGCWLKESWIAVAGEMSNSALVEPGWTVNASWLAAPGTMLKAALVVAEGPEAVAERV